MNLRDRLASEMKEAMKQKETTKLSVIRLVRSSIMNEDKRHPEPVDEAAVEELIKREAKKRHESIEAFQKGRQAGTRREGGEGVGKSSGRSLFPELPQLSFGRYSTLMGKGDHGLPACR